MSPKNLSNGVPGGVDPTETMKTVTASGLPVKERIGSVAAARNLYDSAVRNDREEARRRARLKGLLDGNPPYNPTRLRELGLGYMQNINFLEARAILDQKAAAHYELFFEVPTLVDLKVAEPGPLSAMPNPTLDYARIVSEEFSNLLRDWSGFLVMMDKVRRESDAYGLGGVCWADEYDWRPEAWSRGSFLPDPGAKLDLEKLPFFFLKGLMSVAEFKEKVFADEKIAAEEGWNVPAVKRLLKNIYISEKSTAEGQRKYRVSEAEEAQQALRNQDSFEDAKEFEQVRIVHLLVMEADTREVSHYIFSEEELQAESNREEKLPDTFLYRRSRRFKKMSEVLWWLPYNFGDGYLRSLRGLLSMVEAHCDLSNRFLGRVFDAGFMTASLLVQPNTPMDLDKLKLVRMGVLTVVPPGVQVQQSTFQPQLAPLVQLRDLSVSIMRNNTGVWKPNPEMFGEKQVQKTARQVAEEVAKEARMEKSHVAFDYDQIDRLYREMFRRLTSRDYVKAASKFPGKEEAKLFIKRCVDRGVPEKMLLTPGAFEVHSTRAIGLGSWGVKLDLSNQVLGSRAMMDEAGQKIAFRDWLAVRVGQHNVDRYAPMVNRNTIASNESSIAALENNDFMEGSQVPVGSDQTHVLHLQAHAAPVVQIIEQVQKTDGEGLDLQKALMYMGAALPHIEQHLGYLAQDPERKPLVDQGQELLKQGLQVYKILASLMQRQQAAQAKAVQDLQAERQDMSKRVQDAEMSVKLAEIEKKYEIERIKQASLNQMRSEKTDAQMAISRSKAEAGVALSAERQAADIRISEAKAAAEIDLKRAKAAAGAGEA